MLNFLGCDSIDQLMAEVVPESIRLTSSNRFNHNGKVLRGICSETLMLERIRQLADSNVVNKSFIG
jgi:glycine cleavage system pyridoxal-binding protein P